MATRNKGKFSLKARAGDYIRLARNEVTPKLSGMVRVGDDSDDDEAETAFLRGHPPIARVVSFMRMEPDEDDDDGADEGSGDDRNADEDNGDGRNVDENKKNKNKMMDMVQCRFPSPFCILLDDSPSPLKW